MQKLIRNVGKINYISSLKDGEGIRVANDFMKLLIEEFSKQSSLYMRNTEEVPFTYGEKQLHSIIAPALSRITSEFLMESPVKRKWSSEYSADYNDSHGWVDYWCRYRNTSFLIELKHGFIATKSGKVREGVKEDWKKALSQLNVIEEEAKNYIEYCNGVFRLALHVLPLYETVNNKERSELTFKDLVEIQKQVVNELEYPPNWSALWMIHDELIGPYEYVNTKECYPGVLFMCSLYEICK